MTTRHLLTACALVLCSAAPAMAVGAQCEDQLAQVSAQMQQQKSEQADLKSKYDQAQKLCAEHQDQQAQAVLRQIRKELAGNATESSGSSEPQGSSSPQK
ncbi:MAG TPA: hypothetical protein VN668_08730 [Stellaceae bacterium]|nr:hypothetical protein [Stellaceae bacterium]